MFGKYNGFVSKARVSACMYFLVLIYIKANCLPMAMLAKFSTITGLTCLIAGSLCLLSRAFLAF
jgi:hypothetical protein